MTKNPHEGMSLSPQTDHQAQISSDKAKLRLHCDLAMARFDFDKVAKVMKFLGWKWIIEGSNGFEVPDADRIRDSAEKLADMLCDPVFSPLGVRGGGLEFEIDPDESQGSLVVLRFVLEREEG